VKDLLVKLGKRVHELRSAKQWSQEEFAHISGFHRTYIGQIERGEKNLSFGNLVKISSALGVTPSNLLSDPDDAYVEPQRAKRGLGRGGSDESPRRALEIQKLVKRLSTQRAVMEQTFVALEGLILNAGGGSQRSRRQSGVRPPAKRPRLSPSKS
jgi:transcriptional regulator with XRE-family HTH domain